MTRRIEIQITDDDDDDNVKQQQPGRPNLYWQQRRQDEEEQERTGFDAGFRGVSQPRMGSMHVRADQTKGSYELCWCGLPQDHNWPGKTDGRHHPNQYTPEELVAHTAAAESNVPHITRSDLRGFGENYLDLILMAVNDHGTRYRLNNKGIMLYPPDGTTPYSLPMRENARTLKAVRLWYAKHIADLTEIGKKAEAKPPKQTDDDIAAAAARLARRLNSPEHPAPPAPAKKAVAKKAAPAPQPEENAVAAATVEPSEGQHPIAEWLRGFTFETAPLPERSAYAINTKGETNPFVAEFGDGSVRCLIILPDGEQCSWSGPTLRGATGHFLAKHSPEHMEAIYGEEAMKQKIATRQETLRNRKSKTQVIAIAQSLQQLAHNLGVDLPGTDTSKADAEVVRLTKQVADLVKERDDLKARLALMQEAFRGLG